jgi:hypothetical protein
VKNKRIHVTGFLCANKHFFLQCLEGEQEVVEHLFQKIELDSRHHDAKILRREFINERSFPAWSMSGILGIDSHQEILGQFSNEKTFEPYELNSKDSLALLKAFSEFRGMTR